MKKFCEDCKKEIFNHGKSIRCQSCARKHYLKINPMPTGKNAYGYIHGKTHNNKCANCGNHITLNAKLCKPCYNLSKKTGKKYPICLDCNKKLGDYLSKRCKSCAGKRRIMTKKSKDKISEANKGKNNGMYGIPSPQGKKEIYKNIKLRNSWEVKYAQYLDKQNIKWQYESKTFDLCNGTYTPDFYLLETNEYIEIKGYWRKKDKKKYNLFKRKYPEIKISILQEQNLKLLKIL